MSDVDAEPTAGEGADAEPVLRVERGDGIATVTLHRPAARNALDRRLRRELFGALSELDADADVRAVVLTGSDPAFCAGLDLKELAAEPSSMRETVVGDRARRAGPVPEMATPLIGAINGPAITGGFELALACDFLVASERARFADTHGRVGILPGWGLSVRLPEAVGLRRAREMTATGNFVDAPTALAWGLVNHVVAHDDLLPFARKLASDVAGNDPEAVSEMLRTYRDGSMVTQAEAFDLELERSQAWLARRMPSPDDLAARRAAVTERGRTQL